MNISNPIPDTIELEYHEEVWQQTLDYEHIPFRYRRCHEYGHLVKEFHLTAEEEQRKSKQQKRKKKGQEGFQEVKSRRIPIKENSNEGKKEQQPHPGKSNSFEILQEEGEDEDQTMEYQEDKEKESSSSSERTHTKRKAQSDIPEKEKEQEEETKNMVTEMEINRGEDLSIEEEVLRKLLNEWRKLDERFIAEDQKRIYAETF